MKKILCVGYRSWALNIYKDLKRNKKNKILIISSKKNFSKKLIQKFKPDIILFYSWSWNVNEQITKKFKSYMLHPSPLPKFRGGSPIQNQIIRGIKKSKLTLFRMNNILDGGNILVQMPLSLEGSISQIFNRMHKIGFNITKKFLNNHYKEKKQNLSRGSFFKRRSPKESEIFLNDIKKKSSIYLFNKIRMLDDPYPNAYIKTKNKKKKYLIKAKI